MFDNSMTGAVGFAMHEDRLAKAADNLRLAEATQVRGMVGATCRARIAQALMALAARIAPSITRPETGTLAPA